MTSGTKGIAFVSAAVDDGTLWLFGTNDNDNYQGKLPVDGCV
jgi:hypothetical protein